jgi:hypothetical protein
MQSESILATRIAGKASAGSLYNEVSRAATQFRTWRTWTCGQSIPVPLDNAEKHIQNFRRICEQAAALNGIVPLRQLPQLLIESLAQLVILLCADQPPGRSS